MLASIHSWLLETLFLKGYNLYYFNCLLQIGISRQVFYVATVWAEETGGLLHNASIFILLGTKRLHSGPPAERGQKPGSNKI